MQIVNNTEDPCMHHHKLIQRHMLTFVSLELIAIENFLESEHDNINLNVIQSVS